MPQANMLSTPSLLLAGRLEAISLPDVLQILAVSRRSGVLRVDCEELFDVGEIEISEGRIVRADVKHGPERLGTVLVRRQSLEPRVLGEALKKQSAAARWKALGTVLLEMEAIGPGELAEGLVEQIETAISVMVSWKSGVFRFRSPRETPQRGGAGLLGVSLDTQEILLEAARRWDETAH